MKNWFKRMEKQAAKSGDHLSDTITDAITGNVADHAGGETVNEPSRDESNAALVNPREAKYPKNDGADPKVSNVHIIHDGDEFGFSLAFGDWHDGTVGITNKQMLLIRWNGHGDKVGYPVSGVKYPAWFPLPEIFAEPVLREFSRFTGATETVEAIAQRYGFRDYVKVQGT